MPIKTLIVDDTSIFRKILSDVVDSRPNAEATGSASSGNQALLRLQQQKYDLVLLDINMPGKDGIETLVDIRKKYPDQAVVMISGVNERGSAITIDALNKGALDFIRKPDEGSIEKNRAKLVRDLRPLLTVLKTRRLSKKLVSRKVAATRTSVTETESRPAPVRSTGQKLKNFKLVAIGVSTGGPNALTQVIPNLPADFPLPILVVQHMPPMFTDALAKDLDRKSALHVKEAKANEPVKAGTVYIAPGGFHMIIKKGVGGPVIGITEGPQENNCKPAVDVLFRSVSDYCGRSPVLSVIMTGMGGDGCKGVAYMKKRACHCITQSAKTCVVYGMPQVVDQAGLSDESSPLEQIASKLVTLAGRKS